MQSSFSRRLLVSLALVSFGRADYFIDDQNITSLIYSENPAGAKWGPFQNGGETLSITLANGTKMTVDASHCFNNTYTCKSPGHTRDHELNPRTDAACAIADNCQLQIPFTGSGITIYVLQAGPQGTNASLTIDGGVPEYKNLPVPSGPYFYTPNVTLFGIQGITTGNHTATITVQNWNNSFSGMMFDYAAINETVVSKGPVASSTAASTPTSTATSSPSRSTINIGAIVGGITGGLVALAAFFLAFFVLGRQHRNPQRFSINLDADTRVEPFFSDSIYHQGPREYTDVTERPTTDSLVTGTVGAHISPLALSSGSSPDQSRSAVTNPNPNLIADATLPSPSQTGSYKISSGPSETSRPQIQRAHPTLTDDQADFVNNLYANNVPAGAIARVIERMMAGERQPAVEELDLLPPPSYCHGTE